MELTKLTNYATRRGELTGATMWRVVAGGTEQRVLPDGVMDLMWFNGRFVIAGPDTRTWSSRLRLEK